jgi:hypothetical protein
MSVLITDNHQRKLLKGTVHGAAARGMVPELESWASCVCVRACVKKGWAQVRFFQSKFADKIVCCSHGWQGKV